MILKEGRVEESRKFSMDVIESVQRLQDINDQWELAEKLILSKQISRNFDQYTVDVPHVEVCRRMEARGETPYGLGDRVPYFALPGALNNSISDFVDTPEFVREHGGRIDTSWYIEKQLMPPLRRVFESIGIDLETGAKLKVESKLNTFKEGITAVPPKRRLGLFAYSKKT